jgi:AraC-like DNA-binding protein
MVMADLARTEFVASAYEPTKRYDAFRETMGCVFDLGRPTKTGSNFDARIESYLLSDCLFVRTETAGHTWSRTEAKIAQDSIDFFLIQLYLEGNNDIRTGDKGIVSGRNSLTIIDTAQPYESVTSDFANVTLVVPRSMLTPDLQSPDAHQTRVLSTKKPLTQVAYDAVLSLWRNTPRLNAEQAAIALKPTVDLVVAAMNGDATPTPRSSRALDWMLRTKIRDYIDRQLHDPALSPAKLQAHFRIPRTRLYELFRGHGGIANIIRDARLSASMRMLAHPTAKRLTVTEIGAACGIDNPTVFSRAFKKRFGMTPRDARRARPAVVREQADATSDRLWEQWVRAV